MPEQQRAQWMEPYAQRVEGEPTTEAGRRLLAAIFDIADPVGMADLDLAVISDPGAAIHAIEAEARIDGRASGVDYERARIRDAVEGIAASGGGFLDILRFIDAEADPHQITCHRCGVSMDRSDDARHNCKEQPDG